MTSTTGSTGSTGGQATGSRRRAQRLAAGEGPGMLRWLFPRPCVGCGRSGAALCRTCLRRASPAPAIPPPPGLAGWCAPFAYEGAIRRAIVGAKYRGDRAAVPALAAAVASVVPPRPAPACVTWVPTTAAHRRDRGFDQAELLARRVARHLRRPARRLLRRVDQVPQTGRPGSARRLAPRFAPRRAAPPVVLVVDDVATTGASLEGAAAALLAGGCKSVIGATAARTPLKGP